MKKNIQFIPTVKGLSNVQTSDIPTLEDLRQSADVGNDVSTLHRTPEAEAQAKALQHSLRTRPKTDGYHVDLSVFVRVPQGSKPTHVKILEGKLQVWQGGVLVEEFTAEQVTAGIEHEYDHQGENWERITAH